MRYKLLGQRSFGGFLETNSVFCEIWKRLISRIPFGVEISEKFHLELMLPQLTCELKDRFYGAIIVGTEDDSYCPELFK